MRTRKSDSEIKPSLVSPIVAALISVVLPGVGHMLARSFGKGFTLFISFISMTGLWIWRVGVEARREVGFFAQLQKSIELLPIILVILILLVLIYLWIIYDAYKTAKDKTKAKSGFLWVLVLIAFFRWDGKLARSNRQPSSQMEKTHFRS